MPNPEPDARHPVSAPSASRLPGLAKAADRSGVARWRPVLRYVAELHGRAIRDDLHGLFPHPWEEIGPGYVYGPAFGHWDIVHQCLDSVEDEPEHALRQLENLLALQQDDGRLPVVMMMREGKPWLHNPEITHPPVWPILVDRLIESGHAPDLGARCVPYAVKQLAWFDAHRRAGEAYGYADFLTWRAASSRGWTTAFASSTGPRGSCLPSSTRPATCTCCSTPSAAGAPAARPRPPRTGRRNSRTSSAARCGTGKPASSSTPTASASPTRRRRSRACGRWSSASPAASRSTGWWTTGC